MLVSPPSEIAAQTAGTDLAPHWLRVALDVPLPGPFDYRGPAGVQVGQRVIVPFGRRKLIGVVVGLPTEPSIDPASIKTVEQVLDDLPPLPEDWRQLVEFAADYYQRPVGEVALPVLPAPLRQPASYQGKRSGAGPVARHDARVARARKKAGAAPAADPAPASSGVSPGERANHDLTEAQVQAVERIVGVEGFRSVLLHGVTGSGKTEVYLHAAREVLHRGGQVLLMVPEINLTPQLEGVLRHRLREVVGDEQIAVLHSGLSDGERLDAWLRVQRGQARILLGTRMSIFAPMPDLGLIIVDEEHDPSYKQQDGLRYSARDLAVWRARNRRVPVVLGSATPSLETWRHATSGQYLALSLPERASGSMPAIRLIDTRRLTLNQGMSEELEKAIDARLAAGEQSLIYLNRRGYAPVLHCMSCAWVSHCPQCSVFMVLHRNGARGHRLQCHHCGYHCAVPRACPDCGDQDLQPMGRGTQRIEEYLAQRFPTARIARIDADSTRRKGSAQALFAQVHAGEVDILVGTQMVAKGHDFSKLGLVGVLNADAMLFAHDFRAPERLFAQLMQVSGRAGRHAEGGQVMIQTQYPEQALYQALRKHDYAGFASHELTERQMAGLPPFTHQALLTAQARELSAALAFLQAARDGAAADSSGQIMAYDPVPLRVVRVANIERAQLLVESASRPALQAFLSNWQDLLLTVASEHRVRWQLEVDPLEI